MEERLRILSESRNLKMMAEFFLHPEKPIYVDPTVRSRCYFDRSTAPQQLEVEEFEAEAQILFEISSLKKLAMDYLHPELPVKVDASVCARCYFDRPSAPPQETIEEAAERDLIMEDMKKLKSAAQDYLHPEAPLKIEPAVFGRNYFMRPSADVQYTAQEETERQLILQDARELANLAHVYRACAPLEVSPTAFGRNFFTRPSAPAYLSIEEENERNRILDDAKALHKFAVDFLHPERHLQAADPILFGRNYFTRPSAFQPVPEDDAEITAILEDAKALHKLAVDYRHPELPVATTDPTVFGRNYFSRLSASEQEPEEEDAYRNGILEDVKALKRLAVDYLHPELPVLTGPTLFGRNYFSRPSAPEQLSDEDEDRKNILADVKGLQRLAVAYLHPEIPIVASDPTIFGRNFFTRASAAPPTTAEDDEEEELVMIEAGRLEQLAMDYHHPELPVRPRDPAASGRELLVLPAFKDMTKIHAINETEDRYWHHAHFDMEDHVHRHHVDFDRNKSHHDEISKLRFATPSSTEKALLDFDQPIPTSPECVMTFAQPKDISSLPYLP